MCCHRSIVDCGVNSHPQAGQVMRHLFVRPSDDVPITSGTVNSTGVNAGFLLAIPHLRSLGECGAGFVLRRMESTH